MDDISLRTDNIESIPILVDWDVLNYKCFEAKLCLRCRDVVVGHKKFKHNELDKTIKCTGFTPLYGPNNTVPYYYPIRLIYNPEESAKKLLDKSLCLIETEFGYGIAVTGVPSRLSIQTAYMQLGQLPPVQLCDVETKPVTDLERWALMGCEASAVITLHNSHKKLLRIRKHLKGYKNTVLDKIT